MTTLPPRLTASEMKLVKRAGYQLPKQAKASIFGSMFSWFPNFTNRLPTFWPVGANAKPPINAAQSNTGQIVTPESAMTLSAAWSCTWLTAKTMASMPFDLKAQQKNGAGKDAVDHALYDLLRWQPNSYMDAYTFWTCLWAQEMLWGAGYAVKRFYGDEVISLEPLLSEWMTPYLTEKGVLEYRYDEPTKPQTFKAKDLFVLKTRSLDGYTGTSVIEFARNSLGLAQSGELAASKTFKKGLNASGFIKVDKFLKEKQREEFREEIDEFTGDGKRAGGVMVLEGGVDWGQIAMSPVDAELLLSRQFSVEEVCRWWGIPPLLIGHSSAGQTMWGSGVEQIFSAWLRLNLRSYVTCGQQAVRAQLLKPGERASYYAEYDLDDLLAPDSQARANLYSTQSQNGIKTRNELRAKEGDEPLPGGDILTVQSNLIPLEQLGKIAEPGAADASGQKLRDALLNFLGVAEAIERATKQAEVNRK